MQLRVLASQWTDHGEVELVSGELLPRQASVDGEADVAADQLEERVDGRRLDGGYESAGIFASAVLVVGLLLLISGLLDGFADLFKEARGLLSLEVAVA